MDIATVLGLLLALCVLFVPIVMAGNLMLSLSYFVVTVPFIVVGSILWSSGEKKLNDAYMFYYNNCFNMDVCDKYGIVIIPYNTAVNFNKNK